MEHYLLNKLRQVFIRLGNSKSHLLINIGGLSASFAALILIMIFVINEFQFDKFNTNGSRIYRIEESDNVQVPIAISNITTDKFPEVENSVVIKSFDNHWVSYEKNFFEIEEFCFAENSIFEIFTIPFIYGESKTALTAPYTIVLSESVAKKIFGNINPIGKQVNFKDQGFYTVTGVIKDLPNFHLPVKAIASFKSIEDRYGVTNETWGWSLVSYLMLVENHDKKDLENKMDILFKKNDNLSAQEINFKLRPFNDIYLATDVQGNDETKHGNLHLLIILIVTGILILVIASINFINLSISLGLKKFHEILIRMINGCSTRNIIIQHIANSVLLCTIAFLVSIFIVLVSFDSYENLIGKELNTDSMISLNYFLPCILGIVVFGIICGSIPAYYLTRNKSDLGLRERLSLKKNTNFNLGLITFQYAISIILICGTILTFNQLDFIRNRNLGFNTEHVLNIELTDPLKKNLDGFKKLLLDNPNISAVSFISDDITQLKEYQRDAIIDGENYWFNYAYIDPDFINLMGINLVDGNNFSWDIPSQMKDSYMVNEAAWDIIKNSSLKEEGYSLDKRKLVGVVNNFHFESLHYKVFPMIFYWVVPRVYNNVLVKLSNENYSQTINYIEDKTKELAPGSICKYNFLDQSINQLYESEDKIVKLLGIFSLLAIVIASIGIITLSSIAAENRTKEIGIRKVNGAKTQQIVAMLNKGFAKWVAIAFVIACPIAWFAMNKWLENFAYKTELSWWIFALAGILTMGIALLTVSLQSWRAATRNPVESLRCE